MAIFFFPFCFFLFKFSSADPYLHTDAELGWTATMDYEYPLSDGKWYNPTGIGFRGLDVSNGSPIKFRLVFLGNQGSTLSSLCIVAWDDDIDEVADVIWTAKTAIGTNATLLQFQEDGNLVLRDETKEIWSTNTDDRVEKMWLTEYGALLLLDSDNMTVWSSFNHPINKLVCGQVLQPGMELANGNYHFIAEERGAALYMQQHLYKRWNFTYLTNATTFVALCCGGSGPVLQLGDDTDSISDFGYYWQSSRDNCTTVYNESLLRSGTGSETYDPLYQAVVTLEGNGDLTINKLSLRSSFFQGKESCKLPTVCGHYGLCFPDNSSCSCPLNSTFFKLPDDSNKAIGCQLGSGYTMFGDCQMFNQTGIDYYETAYSSPNQKGISEEECYRSCLSKNSTCNAAFYHHHESTCFLVNEINSLISANKSYSASFKLCKPPSNESASPSTSNATAASSTSNGAASSPPSKYKKTNVVLTATIAAGISCLLLMFIIGLVVYLRRRNREDGEEEDGILSNYLSEATVKRFTLKELEQITSGFSEQLGTGAFGTVYKGQLPNGNYVAVKSLNGLRRDAKDFYAELSVLSRVRHFNLVQLLGFCNNKKARALIYEYMANGSLDRWLLDKESPLLSWEARMEIAIGSARGIAYLHEDCQEKVLHLDVKPQNILLDENFYPKVSDFGLSRLLDRAEDHFFMTTICGTPGYLAPELMRGEAIGVESDVYSFGVVLLVMLSGVRSTEPKGEEIWNLSKDDRIVKSIVDNRLGEAFSLEEARRIIKIAALCINQDPCLRPQMSSVVQMLEGKIEIPQLVSTPQFYPKIQGSVNAKFMALLQSRSQVSSSSQAGASTSMSVSTLLPR